MQKTGLIAALVAFSGISSCEMPKQFDYRENTPVRVTEVYFESSAEHGDVEFIEIASVAEEPIDVSGWQVTGAGRLAIPPGTTLNPKSALVICRGADAFKQAFSGVVPVAMFTGKLSNQGETIRVEDPSGQVADEVTYNESDPEVLKAAGTGMSIHRQKVTGQPLWRAAKPTPGSTKS